jgi:nitroreductase
MKEIFERRSVRKYDGRPVDEAQIELLLRAAMCAPTAKNVRPWEFLVITERDIMNRIASVHPYAKMLKTASCAIIVCALPGKSPGTSDDYFPQDCAAATENILLQAVSMGLGTVWCGVYPKAERIQNIRDIVPLPENIIPFNVIAVGYPDDQPRTVEKFNKDIIHYNKW